MLFLNEDLFNNESQLNSFLTGLNNHIEFNIKILNMYKSILLDYTLKIAIPPDNVDTSNNVEQIITILTKLKYFFALYNQAIESAKLLQDNYNKLKIPYELSELQNYYDIYIEKLSEIESAQLELSDFFVETTELLNYKIPDIKNEPPSNILNDNAILETEENIPLTSNSDTIPKEVEEKPNLNKTNSNTESENDNLCYPENTLIISETTGTVLLPYLKNELSKFENELTDKNELIKKYYIVPIEKYKNPVLSRFREAFKLMRNIEKKSIFESIDLGMELSFNSKLHPAIISACRNLDELDIYLDYLDNNQTDKYNCFSITFEIPPL